MQIVKNATPRDQTPEPMKVEDDDEEARGENDFNP